MGHKVITGLVLQQLWMWNSSFHVIDQVVDHDACDCQDLIIKAFHISSMLARAQNYNDI